MKDHIFGGRPLLVFGNNGRLIGEIYMFKSSKNSKKKAPVVRDSRDTKEENRGVNHNGV